MENSKRLTIFAAGAAICAASFLYDNAVIAWVTAHRDPSLQLAAKLFTKWGDFPPIAAVLLVGLLIAWLAKKPFATRVILLMLGCACVTGILANIVRILSGRTRPSAKVPPGWYGFKDHGHWIAGKFDYSSFPSAHTAVAMGCIAPLWLLLPARLRLPIALPATLLAAGIAASRILLNAHHLSDVLVSTWLGILVGTMVCARFRGRQP